MKSVTTFLTDRGFTLIELMVTLAVGLLLTSWVVLSIQDLLEKQRLSAAVEAVQTQLVLAKSEAAKRSQEIAVRIAPSSGGTPWVVGISDDRPGDFACAPGACTLSYPNPGGSPDPIQRVQAVSGADYAAVVTASSVDAPEPFPDQAFVFEPVRATVNPGTLTLSTASYSVNIAIDEVGNMRICSPNFGRYPLCGP